jgi:signal transduction histidine kinase
MERAPGPTDRADAETDADAGAPALETLSDVVAGTDGSFDDRVTRLLATGRDRLGLSTAFYARVDGGVRTIRAALGDRPGLHEGAQAPLEDSVCRHALAADRRAVVVEEAPAVGGEGDDGGTAGRSVVARLTVDGSVHGALCLAGASGEGGRSEAADRTVAGLLATWLGHELERRADAARLRRRTERLDEFSGVVAHDLRSPLNVATGQVGLARDALADGDAAAARDHLADAAAAHDRMDELIDELLALARQGETVGDAGPVGVGTVARAAATVSLPETATLRIDAAAGDRIVADAERLRTLFENLFRNAVEHGADDGPDPDTRTVTVGTLDPRGDERGRAGIYVADDGAGIPPAERERVFEEGYTTGADGTGYGLSIVSAIAEAHDWTVSLEAAGSGGARFEFRGVDLVTEG